MLTHEDRIDIVERFDDLREGSQSYDICDELLEAACDMYDDARNSPADSVCRLMSDLASVTDDTEDGHGDTVGGLRDAVVMMTAALSYLIPEQFSKTVRDSNGRHMDNKFALCVDMTPVAQCESDFAVIHVDDDEWDSFDCEERWQESASPSGSLHDFAIAMCDLAYSCKPKDGDFVLHWRDGSRVRVGDRFRTALSDFGKSEMTVAHVCVGDDTPYVYTDDGAGYPIASCEHVRDGVECTYNIASEQDEFECRRCGYNVVLREKAKFKYCPGCGRTIL